MYFPFYYTCYLFYGFWGSNFSSNCEGWFFRTKRNRTKILSGIRFCDKFLILVDNTCKII